MLFFTNSRNRVGLSIWESRVASFSISSVQLNSWNNHLNRCLIFVANIKLHVLEGSLDAQKSSILRGWKFFYFPSEMLNDYEICL